LNVKGEKKSLLNSNISKISFCDLRSKDYKFNELRTSDAEFKRIQHLD